MPKTQVRSEQIGDGQVTRADLNTEDTGSAVIRKVIAGTGITLSSTGADDGTGDVTISVNGGGSPPTGTIVMYGGTTAPSDWLLCDGSQQNRELQANLFAVIGTMYGPGDGSDTFNLPDLRSRFPIGAETATDHDLGETGGKESWGIDVDANTFNGDVFNDAMLAFTSPGDAYGIYSTDTSADNRPPFIALNFIIKT